jgi:AmiR/NasT family two-component response regulator
MDAKTIRALIAEDDALVGDVIQRQLQKIGVAVVGRASDGQRAVELAQALRPDIVLMDIEMPEMDGLEAARQMQERCPLPVIVLTAHAGQELVDQAAAAGVGAYLLKSSGAQELDRAITIARARFADLMELRRLNAELQAALAEVKTLSGLLPICASCKKIRDDQGYWQQVEVYICDHSEAEFSHGLCPDCAQKLYPEFYGDEHAT